VLISFMDGPLCLRSSSTSFWHINAVRGPSNPSLRGAKATKQSRVTTTRLDCFAGARN